MAMRTLKDNNRRKFVGVRLYLFFFPPTSVTLPRIGVCLALLEVNSSLTHGYFDDFALANAALALVSSLRVARANRASPATNAPAPTP